MKRFVWLGILFFVSGLQAQELLVCYDKTVNIIFPYAIVSEDHGSNGIIVQQRKGATHILHVKANQKNFSPTSLSVVTSDGHFYSFVVRYAADVTRLNYVIDPGESVAVTEVTNNQQVLEWQSARVTIARNTMRSKSRNEFAVLSLQGLYITEHALWLKSQLANHAMVPFVPGFVKFFIRSKRRAKNAAVQERELVPVYQETPDKVDGGTEEPFVFALDPFVINRHQQLIIQVGEQNGRLIQLRIQPRHFRKVARIDQ